MPQVKQAYTHPLREMVKQEHGHARLLSLADEVRVLVASPAWKLVAGCVDAAGEQLTAQLLNPSIQKLEKYAAVTAEIRGLKGMQDAAETIIAFAEDRERAAKERLAAQEQR